MQKLALLCILALLLCGCATKTVQESAGEIGPGGPTTGVDMVLISDNGSALEASGEIYGFADVASENGSLIVYYFHSSGCGACKALAPEIERLEADYPDVTFIRYDLADVGGSAAYRAFAEEKNLSTDRMLVPQVLVNGTIITDRFSINDSLEGIISAFSGAG